jgi:hypothetical protein
MQGKPMAAAEETISIEEQQLMKLDDIADYAERIHFWIRFWSIFALIGVPILLLLALVALK